MNEFKDGDTISVSFAAIGANALDQIQVTQDLKLLNELVGPISEDYITLMQKRKLPHSANLRAQLITGDAHLEEIGCQDVIFDIEGQLWHDNRPVDTLKFIEYKSRKDSLILIVIYQMDETGDYPYKVQHVEKKHMPKIRKVVREWYNEDLPNPIKGTHELEVGDEH